VACKVACRVETGLPEAEAGRSVRPIVRRGDPISELRRAIDCLPRQTREAMLAGVRSSAIVVGAYTGPDGGICPMLAAHRNGGRTTFLAFARAWDRLGGFTKKGPSRRATRRELRILVTQLEASLDGGQETDLGAAIAEHRAAKAARAARPTEEIRAARLKPTSDLRHLRPSRRDATAALARFERERAGLS